MHNYLLDTNDLEPFLGLGVHEILAVNLEGRHGVGRGRQCADRGEKAAVGLWAGCQSTGGYGGEGTRNPGRRTRNILRFFVLQGERV